MASLESRKTTLNLLLRSMFYKILRILDDKAGMLMGKVGSDLDRIIIVLLIFFHLICLNLSQNFLIHS
jgi:hypothetical protein